MLPMSNYCVHNSIVPIPDAPVITPLVQQPYVGTTVDFVHPIQRITSVNGGNRQPLLWAHPEYIQGYLAPRVFISPRGYYYKCYSRSKYCQHLTEPSSCGTATGSITVTGSGNGDLNWSEPSVLLQELPCHTPFLICLQVLYNHTH